MRSLLLCCLFSALVAADGDATTSDAPAADDLPSKPVLPDVSAMAPVLVDELPPFDTSGWPESPSKVSGERIWQPPACTHWPGVVYDGERRHIAVAFPLRAPGSVELGWVDGESAEVEIPLRLIGKRHSGLLWLPSEPGVHMAKVVVPLMEPAELPVRIVAVDDPDWPHDHLVNGMPVDAEGRPVVITMPRWEPERKRRWAIFAKSTPRPDGEPILLGDPLTAFGGDSWAGLAATRVEATDPRYPHHALLPKLAAIAAPWPKTIVWSPGNAGLEQRTWNGEDERMLALIRSRAAAFGALPRMVLVLPPLPVDASLRTTAVKRREILLRTALFLDWEVVDAARICGDPEQANSIAPDVYVRYPVGDARARLTAALAETLERE